MRRRYGQHLALRHLGYHTQASLPQLDVHGASVASPVEVRYGLVDPLDTKTPLC